MLMFCPNCASVLVVEIGQQYYRFACNACPYVHILRKKITFKKVTKLKESEDAFGGPEAWKNCQTERVTCPQCDHNEAFFMQIQTRSADEPSTLFYRCCSCTHVWKVD